MSGKSASLRRAECGERSISVYPAETALGWRVILQVSPDKATAKLACGAWREVQDEHGNFLGCQVVANFKKDEDLPSGASSTSITVRECELNAGLIFKGGKSRTAGMSEEERVSRKNRFGKQLPPEDSAERAQAKIMEWPLSHGDKAVRVYPKG